MSKKIEIVTSCLQRNQNRPIYFAETSEEILVWIK